MADITQFKYRAFLSYSHRDKAWGKWLHAALEGYRIDKDLVGRETPVGPAPKTLRPIFRDREDFSAGHSLTAQTIAALKASQFLIVICSPSAAQSKYVNEEIRHFKALGRGDRVVPVIVDGEPGGGDSECFPTALRFKVGSDGAPTSESDEPVAADVRANGDGKALAKYKVVSALLGVHLDELVRRSERVRKRQNRFWAALAGVFLLLAVTATVSAVAFWEQLKTNEAFLDITLKSATDIVNNAVEQAEKYGVPRVATLKILVDAEKLFDHMAQLGRPTPELRHRKALMLLEFANNYAILGDTESQRERADNAQQLIRELAADQPNSPELQKALYNSYIHIGDAFLDQGQLERSLKHHTEALAIARRLAAWKDISQSYQRIGDLRAKQGFLLDAMRYFYNLKSVAEMLGSRIDRSIAHERIGGVLAAMHKHDEALIEYRGMLQIAKTIVDDEPTKSFWHRNLHVAHVKVGQILLQQQKPDEALLEYRAGLSIINALANKDISNSNFQHDLAVSYRNIGEVLLVQGNIPQALENYRLHHAIFERLAHNDPKNVNWQLSLAESYASIADANVAQHEFADALTGYRASHDIWERVAVTDPSNIAWQMDLLWSHSRLAALFGDQAEERLQFIVETLSNHQKQGRLTPLQEAWIPPAEEALAAMSSENKDWKFDLLSIYWRTASFTPNPLKQYVLVVARAQNLRKTNELPAEQSEWLIEAEQYIAGLRSSRS